MQIRYPADNEIYNLIILKDETTLSPMILDFIEIINTSLEFGLKWLIGTVGLFLNFACTFIIIPSNFFHLVKKDISWHCQLQFLRSCKSPLLHAIYANRGRCGNGCQFFGLIPMLDNKTRCIKIVHVYHLYLLNISAGGYCSLLHVNNESVSGTDTFIIILLRTL